MDEMNHFGTNIQKLAGWVLAKQYMENHRNCPTFFFNLRIYVDNCLETPENLYS